MKKILFLIIIILLISFYINSSKASTITVPADYSTIQAAINTSLNGDEIVIQPGIYYENINFNGKAIKVRSEDPNNADIIASTIIDGNSLDSAVSFENSEDTNTIISGFTIRNGRADDGGGIYCYYSSPSITNCTINGNSVTYGEGGGIYCYYSFPNIANCTINENSTTYGDGGGIYCNYYSSPNITNCTINQNYAVSDGGGIYCNYYSFSNITNCTINKNSASSYGGGIYCSYYSSPNITNCTINENSAHHGSGGGIYHDSSSSLSITSCTISGNYADGDGSGIYCDYRSSPSIINCTISGNSVHHDGGGIFCDYYSSPDIINCTISGNHAHYGGGIFCDYHSSPNIINCTISRNWAIYNDGGGIFCDNSFPTITNCILWNNNPSKINGSASITYSCIQGGYGDPNTTYNITEDPLFIDPALNDFHLNPNSPCIDAGDPNSTETNDKDGNIRPVDGDEDGLAISDMGAYEWQPICNTNLDFDGDGYNNCEDCDDMDPNVYPGASEICDWKDTDCDGNLPVNEADSDADGFIICRGDCDDTDATIYPGASEFEDNKDNDCNGIVDDPNNLVYRPTTPTLKSPINGGIVTSLRPTLSVNNSTDKDSTFLEYEFELYTDPNLSNKIAFSTEPEGNQITSWDIIFDLIPNSVYYWCVTANDGEFTSSRMPSAVFIVDPDAEDTIVVIETVQNVSASNLDTQTVKVDDPNSDLNGVSVEIPHNALDNDTMITIGVVTNPPAMPHNIRTICKIIEFGPSGTIFNTPITIRIPYSQEDLNTAGIDNPEDIEIYTFNTVTLSWEKIPVDSVDTINSLLIFTVNHFSIFTKGIEETQSGSTSRGGNGGIGCFINSLENSLVNKMKIGSGLETTQWHLKDMICRGLLLKLERQGIIIFLPPRRIHNNALLHRKIPELVKVAQTPIEGTVKGINPIELRSVRRISHEKLYNNLIHEHHYLRYTHPVGENLKYIAFFKGRHIACMGWTSPIQHLKSRGRLIGQPYETKSWETFFTIIDTYRN